MIMASQCIVKSQNASHVSALYPSGSGGCFFPTTHFVPPPHRHRIISSYKIIGVNCSFSDHRLLNFMFWDLFIVVFVWGLYFKYLYYIIVIIIIIGNLYSAFGISKRFTS